MRFPNDTLPPLNPVNEPTDIVEVTAADPVRRIGSGVRGTMLQPPLRRIPEEEVQREFAEREGEDRRKMCRRIYRLPVMLDTRTGEDRRKDRRRDEDPLNHLSKKV